MERHPDFALGFFNLGSQLAKQIQERAEQALPEEWQELITLLARSTELNPGYHPAWSNLADAHRAHGNTAEALQCYEEALAREPTYYVARNNLGNVLKASGNLAEATVHYELAVSSLSSTVNGAHDVAAMWSNLGAVYLEQDRLAESLNAYSSATDALPNYAPAYVNMGRIVSTPTCCICVPIWA